MEHQQKKENRIIRKIRLSLLFILGCTSMVWAFHFPSYAWFTTSVQTGTIELKTAVEITMDIVPVEIKSDTLLLQYTTNSTAKTIEFEFKFSEEARKYIKHIKPGSISVENTKDFPSLVEVHFEFFETNSPQHPITMVKPSTGNYEEKTISLPIQYSINGSEEGTGYTEIEGITLWVPVGYHIPF